MGVIMKGGTSGNRQDSLAPVPSSGVSQPVLRSERHEPVSPSIHLQAENPKGHPNHFQSQTPDFMPTEGAVTVPNGDGTLSNPSTSDVMQQDVKGLGPDSGDHRVFRGTKS